MKQNRLWQQAQWPLHNHDAHPTHLKSQNDTSRFQEAWLYSKMPSPWWPPQRLGPLKFHINDFKWWTRVGAWGTSGEVKSPVSRLPELALQIPRAKTFKKRPKGMIKYKKRWLYAKRSWVSFKNAWKNSWESGNLLAPPRLPRSEMRV